MVHLHSFYSLKLRFLSLQLVVQFTTHASAVQSGSLIVLELSFQVLVQLFDVIVQSLGVSLHLLYNKLELGLLSFFFLSSSFQLLLFYLEVPLSLSILVLQFFKLFFLFLSVFIILLSFFFPAILYILDQQSILFLDSDDLFIQTFDSQI